ncbi:MAG: TetR/AcrR family transcriptional regulator [Clostridia bacterium]|nr:TetR/AcrR family transcriptional regulator [Clostridia bacterium]
MSKGNRCVERSREMLRKAYAELFIERDEEKITVAAVIERAGLCRNTFYAHYDDILSLAKDVKEDFEKRFDGYIHQMPERTDMTDPLPLLEGISQFMMDSKEQCKLLLQSPKYATFMEKTKQVLVNSLCEHVEKVGNQSKTEALMLLYMLAGSMGELYTRYLEGKLDCTLQQIIDKMVAIYYEQLDRCQQA